LQVTKKQKDMGFFRNFGTSISSYGKAFQFIFTHQLYWAFLFPIILNVALFVFGFSALASLTGWLQATFEHWINFDKFDFWMHEHLNSVIYWIIALSVKIIFFLIFLYYSGFVVLIIMSPILAYLSEKTEKIITGKDYPFSINQLIKDIVRSILLNLRNIIVQLGINIILFIASFIPIIGWLTPLAMFISTSYFYGFSNLDYSNERHQKKIKESVHFVRKNKGLAIGNGFLFGLSLFIPLCGFFLSGFIAIIAVVAATITYLAKEQETETDISSF
jgi:CysZ protein